MKESDEFQDEFIKSVISKGASKMPGKTFEDDMMLKINASVDYKKEVAAQLTLSFLYFKIALFLGLGLSLFLLLKDLSFDFDMTYIGIIGLFVILACTFLFTGNYKRLLSKYSF